MSAWSNLTRGSSSNALNDQDDESYSQPPLRQRTPNSRPSHITLRIPNQTGSHDFEVAGLTVVSDLMRCIEARGICPVELQRLVHTGAILSPEEPISVVQHPAVVVLARRQQSTPTDPPIARPPRYGEDGLPADPAPRAPRVSSEYERSCRICFETEGRLISPCLCRGTSRFVHIECLNQWRASSASDVSFFQCDVCGYQYNLRRTQWASVLQSDTAQLCATVLLILLMTLVLGVGLNRVSVLLEWSTAFDPFYELVEFWPQHHEWSQAWWNPTYDAILGGVLLLGFCGLVMDAHERLQNGTFDYRGFLFTVFANNSRILRIFVILGFSYAAAVVQNRVSTEAKQYMTKWGEELLEVEQDLVDTPDLSVNQSTSNAQHHAQD